MKYGEIGEIQTLVYSHVSNLNAGGDSKIVLECVR